MIVDIYLRYLTVGIHDHGLQMPAVTTTAV
jgi:hypothetical protein